MRVLASLYLDRSFTQQAASQLHWAHLQLLLDKFKADPNFFDFITISKQAHEREIEKELTKQHIKDFLLELGAGFAFIGTQVPIEIDSENYFIDVLFYHLKLRAFVVCN